MFSKKEDNPDFIDGYSCPKCFSDNTETYIELREQNCLDCGHKFTLDKELVKDLEGKN